MIKLRVQVPGKDPAVFTLDESSAVIGRNRDTCSIHIPERFVSSEHAQIQVGILVSDLGSLNGVYVDGRKIEEPTLLKGSVFYLGHDQNTSPVVEVLDTSDGSGVGAQLKFENQRLRQRVEELELALDEVQGDPNQTMVTPSVAPSVTPAPRAQVALEAPAQQSASDAEELPDFASFFGQKQEAAPPPVPATPPPARRRSSVPVAAPQPVEASPASEVRGRGQKVVAMIDRLVAEDVKGEPPMVEGPVEQFFTLESFRLVRQVEKVITRLARDFVQLYDLKTQLPNSEGNFRGLAADILAAPDDRLARKKLVEYLQDLRRWLGVSLAANKKAATQVVEELKGNLSAEALVRDEPLAPWKKILGWQEGELWRRAQSMLRRMDRARIEDRIDDFAKSFASELMDRRDGDEQQLY